MSVESISIVIATNRPWMWGRMLRQVPRDGLVREVVVVADKIGAEESIVALRCAVSVRWLWVEPGTKVGEKYALGAANAAHSLIAFRADDAVWHPQQFVQLYDAWEAQKRPPYVGWGHGWFWAPHLHEAYVAAFRTDHVIPGAGLYTKEAAALPWGDAGGVPERASDTRFMHNVRRRFGPRTPLASGTVYGLWLFHGENIWDRTRLKYRIPLKDLSDHVEADYRGPWDELVEDARRTIVEHRGA